MEDLAHFIQSMSEKYGLLDASHKQPQGASGHHIQDHSSSAASNNFNSEECQGSSWECLSIFISGSQSIDCKTVPTVPQALPSVAMPKNLLEAPPPLRRQESNGSLHGFSKLIDISEMQSPVHNANAGISQEEKESPNNDSSCREASSTAQSNEAERGTIYDSCGDLSTIVTMSDYIQQSYYPGDDEQPEGDSFSSFSKNLGPGHGQHLSKRTAVSSSGGPKAVQEIPGTNSQQPGSSAKDSKELHTTRMEQEDSNTFKRMAASAIESGQAQMQQQSNRRRLRGVASTSVGLDSDIEFGEYDIALHDYDIASPRTSKDTHTDGTGTVDGRQEAGELMDKDKQFGERSSRVHHTVFDPSQSFDTSQSFESHGELLDRERRRSLGPQDYSTSNELSPENQQENYGESSPMECLEYLPVSSAMQSRVAHLDEVSKELFAAQSKSQTSSELNFDLGLLSKEELLQNGSSETPMLKKQQSRSARDFSCSEAEERETMPSMKKGNAIMSSAVKHSADPDSKRPGVSFLMPRKVEAKSGYSLEENKFLKTSWEQHEALLMEDLALGDTSSAKVIEGTYESKWLQINKLLCSHGFSPLDWQRLTSSTEIADTFFHTLHNVVRNYGRREKVVQELLADRESLLQEEKRSNEIVQKLESETDTLKRKLATSEQRAELANAAAEKSFLALRKDNQRLEASHAKMIQRCSQLEHGSRAKERTVRKLQEKIQEAVEREKHRRTKEKELYEKLKRKIAVGQKAQGEVGVYERQRAAAEAEMNFLREENGRMCQELREKENFLLSKMQAEPKMNINRAQLDEQENVLKHQLTQAVNQDVKKDTASLQGKLKPHDIVSEEKKTSMSLLQRIQMDAAPERQSHQFLQDISRKQLELNPSSAMETGNLNGILDLKRQDFLHDVCSRLKVADPIRIPGAIDGLLKVVAAVPRMESFIEQVCDTVFNDGSMFLTRESTSDVLKSPEAVPSILMSWIEKLQSAEELRQFKDSIAVQLWARFDEKVAKLPMSSRVAAASVKDLIDVEHQYLLSKESYRDGEMILKAEPQKLLHRIISHFQMLFEIPQLEGVMAVMNSVYIQISEYHNFARAMCSMLGLPRDAGPNTIIATITSILNKA